MNVQLSIVLYCIALHCIGLYCIVLYCIVLYCIVLYCIVLYCIVYPWTHSPFVSLGLPLVPDFLVPEAERGYTRSINLFSMFCHCPGLNIGPGSVMAMSLNTRLSGSPQRTLEH